MSTLDQLGDNMVGMLTLLAKRISELIDEIGSLKAATVEQAATIQALRTALIACRPAVLRDLDRYSLMNATEGSHHLSALLDTIDTAAKGQG